MKPGSRSLVNRLVSVWVRQPLRPSSFACSKSYETEDVCTESSLTFRCGVASVVSPSARRSFPSKVCDSPKLMEWRAGLSRAADPDGSCARAYASGTLADGA